MSLKRNPLPLFLLASLFALPALAAVHPSREKLKPCKVEGENGEVEAFCGTYEVWENRVTKAGRKIGLNVIVIPARSKTPKPDPIFLFAGGPGQGASSLTDYRTDMDLRQERDFVYVDQRGTGGTHRFRCTMGGKEGDLQSWLGEMFPVEAVKACRDELSKNADLTLYTTDIAMDDVDEVRAWLGYDKINLDGTSYGTRAAQTYLRRHPESVRTVTLWGAVPMDETLPISHAALGQRSLDILLGWCEKDAACRGRFPDIRGDFKKVMARLDQGPVTVEVKDPLTGKPVTVQVPKTVMTDGIRWGLYSARTSATLPLALHDAANGNFLLLAQASVLSRVGMVRELALGLLFSVTCAEDIPYIDPASVAARTAGSFLGDDRVRQQMRACSVWPRAKAAPGHQEAVRSDAPVLIVNGERDPVTPPELGKRVARSFPNALHIVIPYGSHSGHDPCLDEIEEEMIQKGTTKGLDTSCVGKIRMEPFALEPPKPGAGPVS